MCGVVGIFGHPEASTLGYLSLYALQHRGQESAGIATADGNRLVQHAGMGLVADVFGTAASPPVHAAAHRWRWALVEQPAAEPTWWDGARRVGAAGDWAIAGRVESGYLSGLHLADRVAGTLGLGPG